MVEVVSRAPRFPIPDGRRSPQMRETMQRLGLVSLDQVVAAIVAAVESPATGVSVVEVPAIRAALKAL